MKFALTVNAGPYHSPGAASAYAFAVAALAGGHEVVRVFFHGDGVYNAMRDANPPAGAPHWPGLAQQGVDLVLCATAAERRGVLGVREDGAEDFSGVAPGFRVAGLGLWMDACLAADRVLVFHG